MTNCSVEFLPREFRACHSSTRYPRILYILTAMGGGGNLVFMSPLGEGRGGEGTLYLELAKEVSGSTC